MPSFPKNLNLYFILENSRKETGVIPKAYCPGISCNPSIAGQRCLPNYFVCNKKTDCLDASDEINCKF